MRPIEKVGRVDSLGCALLCAILGGCLDEAPSDDHIAMTARLRFDTQAWPALSTCAGCHAARPAIDFLAPGTADGAYTTIFEFQPPVIDAVAPSSSLLLTMGKHTGPAFAPQAAANVLAWLEAERDERVPDMGATVRIGPFLPELGVPMMFDLGVAGATLTMLPETSDVGLYVSRLALQAGSGVRVSHPLFISRPPQPVLDEIDRFSELDLSLTAGQSVELGPAWFLSFEATDYLTIHFKKLEAL